MVNGAGWHRVTEGMGCDSYISIVASIDTFTTISIRGCGMTAPVPRNL